MVATGFGEPSRQYGLNKCVNEWVLFLDTDERLNPAFKSDIRGIMEKADCKGFVIRRYEYEYTMEKLAWISWQLRLYKRNSACYKGDLHEQATIDGKVNTLEPKYYLRHLLHSASRRRTLPRASRGAPSRSPT